MPDHWGSDVSTIGIDDLCETEVTDLYEAILTTRPPLLLHQKDIGGLQIAMKYAGVMSCFHTRYHLLHDRCRALRIDGAFATQQVIESFTLHVLHHQKEHAFCAFTEVIDVDDVWVTDRRCRPRFAFEARDCFAFLKIFVVENVGTNCFYRDLSREQILIACEIDLAHRTASET